MADVTAKLAGALGRLIDVSMVAMTDKDFATEQSIAIWNEAIEALRLYDAAKAQPKQAAEPVEAAAKAVAADWQKDEPNILAWDALPEESKEMARHQARVVLNAVAAPVAQAEPIPTQQALDAITEANSKKWRECGLCLTALETFRLGEAAHGIKEQQP